MKHGPNTSAEEQSPFPGPSPFAWGDARQFAGRNKECADVGELIRSYVLVMLYAQSGAGKTSLLNAGVGPDLEGDGIRVLTTRVGGNTTLEKIRNVFAFNALAALTERDDRPTFEKREVDSLGELSLFDGFRKAFHRLDLVDTSCDAALLQKSQGGRSSTAPEIRLQSPVVLIVDQFEELFTTHILQWKQRGNFIAQLTRAIRGIEDLHVLLSIREDYIAHLDPFASDLPDGLRIRYRLERLRKAQAIAAITEPLATRDIELDRAVVERSVDDLLTSHVATPDWKGASKIGGEFVEPLHLQLVATSLWGALSAARELPPGEAAPPPADASHLVFTRGGKSFVADAAALKDIGVTLAEVYRNAVHEVVRTTEVSEKKLREAFSELFITQSDTRGLVDVGALERAGISQATAEALVDKKVLRREPRAGAVWYELTHDRLIEPIRNDNSVWQHERRKPLRYVVPALVVLVAGGVLALRSSQQGTVAQLAAKEADLDKVEQALDTIKEAANPSDNPVLPHVKTVATSPETADQQAAVVLAELEVREQRLKDALDELERARETIKKLESELDTKKDQKQPRPRSGKVEPVGAGDDPEVPTLPAPPKAPIASVINPTARAEPVKEDRYWFYLTLNVPPDRVGEIAKVRYYFNHPSFGLVKGYFSENPNNKFQIRYYGWGCLRSVEVTVTLKDGSTVLKNFDMCAALKW